MQNFLHSTCCDAVCPLDISLSYQSTTIIIRRITSQTKMVASYRVEIDLKPIDENYGMPITEGRAPPSAPPVRSLITIQWTYGRNEIPDFIARKGISLGAWERAVDCAQNLLEDSNFEFQQALYRHNADFSRRIHTSMVLAMLTFVLPGMFVVLLVRPTADNFTLVFLMSMPWAICATSCRARPMIAQYNQRRDKFLEQLSSQFEEKWSNQVRDLNAEYQQYGITVDKCCKRVPTIVVQSDLPWSIGLVFRFEMQPRNQEEAAWFLAHCRTSADSDATFERRTMRVMPADPSVCGGSTIQEGTCHEMVVAWMVDDEHDYAGHVRDGKQVNGKSTPVMDLV
jgi:hypothetical protein